LPIPNAAPTIPARAASTAGAGRDSLSAAPGRIEGDSPDERLASAANGTERMSDALGRRA
jgi:hypothetical protein